MTDVFRSEILAVVMQQILDEPVLPTLFMRTVSRDFPRFPRSTLLTHATQGDPSRQNVQIADRFRLHDATITVGHKKDMDNPFALGGFHPMCPDRCPSKLSGAVAASERATAGASGEATKLARPTT
jgi:hypothetical protein